MVQRSAAFSFQCGDHVNRDLNFVPCVFQICKINSDSVILIEICNGIERKGGLQAFFSSYLIHPDDGQQISEYGNMKRM